MKFHFYISSLYMIKIPCYTPENGQLFNIITCYSNQLIVIVTMKGHCEIMYTIESATPFSSFPLKKHKCHSQNVEILPCYKLLCAREGEYTQNLTIL